MKIGVIADDFTGASDIALTLAEAGLTVTQFIGVPTGDVPASLGAAVIALKSRTAPVAEAVSESQAAAAWLRAQGATQIILKVCSTFDSTPHGNIGPVLDVLADDLAPGPVMVCPAFPENGRSVYQGHLFVADTLLSESGMEAHPLTPMTDPDLRRVLAAQSKHPVGHVPAALVAQGPDAIRAALPDSGHVIVDAIQDADLMAIGAAAKGAALLCGGSGIALGLPANFGAAPKTPSWAPVTGPGLVLSGSCSRATLEQVSIFKAKAPVFEITAEKAMAGIDAGALADWALAQDTPPLVTASAPPQVVAAAQEKHGKQTVAEAIENCMKDVAQAFVSKGGKRIVSAGGETSGAVVAGTGATALDIGPRIAAGVPLVRSAGLALALKSGNFGGPDFFAEALSQMESV